MQKFFICTGGVAKGPYQLEDLLNFELTEQDLIWTKDWGISKYAFEIDELRGYLKKSIHTVAPEGNKDTVSPGPSPDTIKNRILFSLLFVLLLLISYYFYTY